MKYIITLIYLIAILIYLIAILIYPFPPFILLIPMTYYYIKYITRGKFSTPGSWRTPGAKFID